MMVVSALGDIPLLWMVVSVVRPAHPWLVHGLVLAVSLGAVGWALAVRSVICAMPHVIDDGALWLGGSARYAGTIDRAAVRQVQVLQQSRYAWAANHGIRMNDVSVLSRLDQPNVAIELIDAGRVCLSRQGKTIAPRRWVLLYADRPQELIAALSRQAMPMVAAVA